MLWDWLGEALAVDFANTTKRFGGEERELLEAPGDLAHWAAEEAGRVPAVEPEAARLDEVRILRDDVKALLTPRLASPEDGAESSSASTRGCTRRRCVGELAAPAGLCSRPPPRSRRSASCSRASQSLRSSSADWRSARLTC